MAARARGAAGSAAAAGAAPAAADGEEGGCWLFQLRGKSPATQETLVIYAFLPRLPTLGSLRRLATVLSADPGFVLTEARGMPLPFPAHGLAYVEWERRRVRSGVPEEVARRLEEHWARRPVFPLKSPIELGGDTAWLRRLAGRYGGAEVYALGYRPSFSGRGSTLSTVLELRPSRPLAREELRALFEEALPMHESPRLAETLAAAGLWALAMGAPRLYWEWNPLFGAPQHMEEVKTIPPSLFGSSRRLIPERLRFEVSGPRARVTLSSYGVSVAAPKLDAELLARLEEVERAWETFRGALERWDDLLDALSGACAAVLSKLGVNAPSIVGEALADRERPGARVWEEGGKVKVWLAPWFRGLLAARLKRAGLAPEDYLRMVSERVRARLGVEVELVGEEPPFRFSPEVDAAHAQLKEAAARVASA
jgi:hypothetical protein